MTNDSRFDPMVPAGSGDRPAQGRAESAAGGLRRDHPAAGVRERRRLGQDRLGGRDRQRVHPAPGVLLGAPAGGNPLVEPGRDRTGGGPLAAAAGLVRWPCNGRRSSPPPGSGFPCRGWSSSARRAASPWVYAATSRPTDAEQQLFRAPAFNVFRDGRVCPGSHRFPEEVGLIPESFFQSYFSLTGDSRDRSKKHPDNLQALWEEIDGQTEYPTEDLVPQCTVGQAMALSEGRRGYR